MKSQLLPDLDAAIECKAPETQNLPGTAGLMSKLDETGVPWRQAVLLVAITFCLALYAGLNPPAPQVSPASPVVSGLQGDLPGYAIRFSSSFLLFGLVPLGLALLLGYKPRQLGIRAEFGFLSSPLWWGLLAGLVCFSLLGSLTDPVLAAFYPFSKTLGAMAKQEGAWFALHGLCYLVLYYLPWEILFRGILVAIFLPGPAGYDVLDGKDRFQTLSIGLVAVLVQILPTVILHYPHALSEILGAIPFGIVCAGLVLRYRSIIPCLLIHATVGITLDAVLVFMN